MQMAIAVLRDKSHLLGERRAGKTRKDLLAEVTPNLRSVGRFKEPDTGQGV